MEATSRPTVYLDTNHWYALGRAMAGHPDRPEHVDILRALVEQVEQEQLTFPLSAVHYMEVAENPRDDHRKEIADVMALLSRFTTITSAGKIIDEELAQSLHARFGRPAWPIKVEKFGYGDAEFKTPILRRLTDLAAHLVSCIPCCDRLCWPRPGRSMWHDIFWPTR